MTTYIELPPEGGALTSASVADTDSIDLDVTAGILSGATRLSSNAADAGYTRVPIDIQSSSVVGLRAQVQNSLILALLSASGNIAYNATTGFITFTGTLPVANGGTNSASVLANSRVMVSTGGAIVEAATTTTQLGYLDATSSVQTQLNAKEGTITSGTTAQFWRGDKSFQPVTTAVLTSVIDGSTPGAGEIGEVLSASQASNTATGVGATTVWGSVISKDFTAGRWMIWGDFASNENGAVLTAGVQCGCSASATAVGINEFDTTLNTAVVATSTDPIYHTPPIFAYLSATTTYYLNSKFTYSSGTPNHRGRIIGVRIG